MKNRFVNIIIISMIIIASSCKRDEPTPTPNSTKKEINPISQFVYDGLSAYYLWSSEMVSKTPTVNDSIPDKYFKSLLSKTDTDHGWSWITDDAQGLIADFSGTPKDFGYSLSFLWADQAKTKIIAFVKYVFPNTPASRAGIKRGYVITKLNGQNLILSNYQRLIGTDAISISLLDQNYQSLPDVSITPETIQTNPVLFDSVYVDNNSGRKIGYLFYTGYIANYNSSLYDVFSKFKSEGVTDLILDLRYNHGGAITAATYLCSMIVPTSFVNTRAPFVKLSYNSDINTYFDQHKISRTDSLGISSGSKDKNPVAANLNLNKVYIIATGDSYSASELTTFCLKSYVSVVHIGEKTGGKYTASWTIHPYDEKIGVPVYDVAKLTDTQKNTFKNWAMQPIVAKYTNKDGADFSNPGYLEPTIPLSEEHGDVSAWKKIGDTKDVYLGKALYLITNNPLYQLSGVKSVANARRKVMQNPVLDSKLDRHDDVMKKAVILDNVKLNQRQLKDLREMNVTNNN